MKVIALTIALVLAFPASANARSSHHLTYANSDLRFGKIQKSHKLLGINRHTYRIAKTKR